MSNSHWDWGQISAPIYAGVHIKGDGLYDVLMNGSDAQVDALIDELQSFGMEELHITGEEAATLASHGVTFEAGLDVVVEGTSFLNAPTASVQALLGDADTSVEISWAGFGQVLAGGQGGLDNYLDKLEAAGVDTAVFDAGQITKLAKAGLTFDSSALGAADAPAEAAGAGIHIRVSDASFLHDPYGYGANIADIKHLFQGADVTVDLPAYEIDALIAQGDTAFDALMAELKDVGVDAVDIEDNLLAELLDAGITVGDGVSLTVEGTSFLQKDPADLANLFSDGADVTMKLSMDFLSDLGASVGGAQAFMDKALDAHIDTLATNAGEIDLVDALGSDGVLSVSELADMLAALNGTAPAAEFDAADLPSDDVDLPGADSVADGLDDVQILGQADDADGSHDPFHKG